MSINIFKKTIFGILLLLSPIAVEQIQAQDYQFKTVCIDAGHGGKDGATHGLFSKEKDVALAVALELGRTMEKEIKGLKIVYTRTTDDFVPLYERIEIANRAKADLFISIHCNSMPIVSRRVISGYVKGKRGKKIPQYRTITSQNTASNGVETFVGKLGRIDEQDDVLMRENGSMLLEEGYKENYKELDDSPENQILLSIMKTSFRQHSLNFANILQDEYVNSGRMNRGVKEKSLAVLARATMPAVLTEIGFISNQEEEAYMNSPQGRAEICKNIIQSVKKFKNLVETGKAGSDNVVPESKVDSAKIKKEDEDNLKISTKPVEN